MAYDQFYKEDAFASSLTFNKWVPLMCADVALLWTFKQIYNRPPDPRICLTSSPGNNKNNNKNKITNTLLYPPHFFRNHPINYVSVTGELIDVTESQLGLDPEKNSLAILILTVDDGSGTTLKCILFTQQGAYNPNNLLHQVYQVQGFIIDSETFGRQLRIVQFARVKGLTGELDRWCETLRVRKTILTKHWDYDSGETDEDEDEDKDKDEDEQDEQEEEEVNDNDESFKDIDKLPTMFCSFHRKNSVLVQTPNALVTTHTGGVRLDLRKTQTSARVLKVIKHPRNKTPPPQHQYHKRVLKSPRKSQKSSPLDPSLKNSPTITFTRQNTRQDPQCAPAIHQQVYLNSQICFFSRPCVIATPAISHLPKSRRHLHLHK
ncbi:uncharacterized protein SAPINGB_P003201 [Magnusiomyces paraingens]|uniref:CST complex subunit Stn1 N-terminal domain-containing protein n=1 Tax=Magnusiomyces paraingens TaxID=2606893 RepID=A0A5E8BLI2_9ASCO|nr:uncharacterized protein SAPINGB_P003201 [Saprochaete ingens]VVT51752.1 unnamed protein product [Saprochaete ingens]